MKCYKCRKDRDKSDFIKNGKEVKTCLSCREHARKWREKNKERISLYNKLTNSNKITEKTYVYGKKKGAGESEWIKYDSQLDASKKLKLYAPNINKVIKGTLKSTGGYEFKIETETVKIAKKEWKDVKQEYGITNNFESKQKIPHQTIDGIIGKKCCTCKEWQPLSSYNNSANHWDKLRNDCKKCLVLWRKKNKKEISKKYSIYEKKRKKIDPAFKLLKTLRSRLNSALTRKNAKKNVTTLELIGESPAYVLGYLEAKFQEGMSWDNHGEWHIDHIKPCCKFNLLDDEEQKKCFHYTNLQPLWSKDNLSKGGKYN